MCFVAFAYLFQPPKYPPHNRNAIERCPDWYFTSGPFFQTIAVVRRRQHPQSLRPMTTGYSTAVWGWRTMLLAPLRLHAQDKALTPLVRRFVRDFHGRRWLLLRRKHQSHRLRSRRDLGLTTDAAILAFEPIFQLPKLVPP